MKKTYGTVREFMAMYKAKPEQLSIRTSDSYYKNASMGTLEPILDNLIYEEPTMSLDGKTFYLYVQD